MKRNIRGFLVVVCLLSAAPAARAATIVANGTTCMLEDAIKAANDNVMVGSCEAGEPAPVRDVIKLQYDVFRTSVFSNLLSLPFGGGQAALPDIVSEISIESDPPFGETQMGRRTIGRNAIHTTCTSSSPAIRLFTVRGTGASLHLKDLILENGCVVSTADASGGAIYAERPVELTNCMLRKNFVRAGTANVARGGAIEMVGATLTIRDSTIENNEVNGGAAHGGGASTNHGIVVAGSTFRSNKATGSATVTNATGVRGGALYISSTATAATVTLERVLFDLNTAFAAGGATAARGGGVYAARHVDHVKTCLFRANHARGANGTSPTAGGVAEGGGLYAVDADVSSLLDSTFELNKAEGGTGSTTAPESRGGGLALAATAGTPSAHIRNVTFLSNSVLGGGVFSGGGMHVAGYHVGVFSHVTMSANVAGAGFGAGLQVLSGIVHGDNLLFGGNTGGSHDCRAAAASNFISLGFNFLATSSNCGSSTGLGTPFGTAGDHGCTADRKLPGNICVPTIPLSAASIARDKGGSNTVPDARGLPRPRDFSNVANATDGNGSDPGAFEDTRGGPVIIAPAAIAAQEGTAAAIVPAAGTPAVQIIDTPGGHFRGGWLEVTIDAPGDKEHLTVADGDGIVYDAATRELHHGSLLGRVDVTHNGASGAKLRVWDLRETATLDVMAKLLKAIRYTNHHDAPAASRTIQVRVHDGTIDAADPDAGISPFHTIAVTVAAANDKPEIIDLDNHIAPFIEDAHPQGLALVPPSKAFSVADRDFASRSATHFAGGSLLVTIETVSADHETLEVPAALLGTVGTVHATENGDDGQPLRISFGSNAAQVTPDAVENLIRAVRYHNTHETPPATRRVKFELYDAAGGKSEPVFVTVQITPANDAPYFTGTAAQPEHAAGGVEIAPNLTLRDHEHEASGWGGAKLEVQRNTGAHRDDRFTFAATTHATSAHEGGKLTLQFLPTATTAHVTAILRSIKYEHAGQAPPSSVKLRLIAIDGAQLESAVHEVVVSIPFVNDRPSIRNVDGRERPYTEEASAVRIVSTDADVFDPDEAGDFSGGKLTAEVVSGTSNDVLSIAYEGTGAAQIAYSGAPLHAVTYGNAPIGTATVSDGRIEITFDTAHATRDAVSALLRAITYRSDEPPSVERSVKFELNDGDGGTAQVSAPVRVTVRATYVNDRPSFLDLGGEVEYHPSAASPRVLDADATLEDAELDRTHWGGAALTAKRNGNADATDRFGFVAAKLDLVSQHATHTMANGVLTIRFGNSATQAIASEILQSITYSRLDPLPAAITIDYTIDDRNSGAQGTGEPRQHTGAVVVKPRVRTATHLDIKNHAPNPSRVGEAVPVTVELSTAGTPAGKIEIEDGQGQTCEILLPASPLTCTLRPRTTAVTSISARYLGTTDFEASSTSEPHTVTKAPATVAITAAASSLALDSVTVSVSVTSKLSETAAATTISPATVIVKAVKDGVEKSCGSATTANDVRTCTLTGLEAGSWSIQATHPASTDYHEGSASVAHVVTRVPTTTAITADAPDFSLVGQSVVVTVRVTATQAGTVTGSVFVSDSVSGTAPCTAALHNGIGSCSLTPTVAGAHSFTATYSGDVRHAASATAIPEPHEVRELAGRATTVAIRPIAAASTTFGQSLTVGFDVRSGAQAVTEGDVTVWDRDGGSCRALASAGQCVWTPVAAGERRLFATYHGTGTYAPSTSADVTHSVVKAPTTAVILSRTAVTSALGSPVSVFVRVSPDHAGLDGAVSVVSSPHNCTAVLGAGGEGNCALTFTSAGPHEIVAMYQGNPRFAGSPPSAPLTHNVTGTPSSGTGRRKGDVDGNGWVTEEDALLALRHALQKVTLTAIQQCPARYDADDDIDEQDAVAILRCSIGKGLCSETRCSN